jgi:hypothetical protein
MDRPRRTITALLLSLLLLPVSATALPVDTVDTPAPEGFVQAELRQSLTSDSTALQERAMRRIRAYAHTGLYDKALFNDLVRPLHDLVASGETVHLRLMALSALDAIGTGTAMAGLKVQTASLESDLLRQTAETILARHAAASTQDTARERVAE